MKTIKAWTVLTPKGTLWINQWWMTKKAAEFDLRGEGNHGLTLQASKARVLHWYYDNGWKVVSVRVVF